MNTATPYRAHLLASGLDANRIVHGLYQGARPPRGRAVRDAGFDLLVLCAQELFSEQPAFAFDGVEVVYCPLDDADRLPTQAEWVRARMAAAYVAEGILRGRRALVTCRAGRNRSGLVSSLTLVALTGCSGEAAAAHVQRARTNAAALTNPYFVVALSAVSGRSHA